MGKPGDDPRERVKWLAPGSLKEPVQPRILVLNQGIDQREELHHRGQRWRHGIPKKELPHPLRDHKGPGPVQDEEEEEADIMKSLVVTEGGVATQHSMNERLEGLLPVWHKNLGGGFRPERKKRLFRQ